MSKIERDIETMERDIKYLIDKINKFTCDGVGNVIINVINLESRHFFSAQNVYKSYYTGRAAFIIYFAAEENPRILGYLLGKGATKKEKETARELLGYLKDRAISEIAGDSEEQLVDAFTNWAGICKTKMIVKVSKKVFGFLDMYYGKYFMPLVH
jgi:hypothetical protein